MAGTSFVGAFAFANNASDETVVTLDIPLTGIGPVTQARAVVYNPGAVAITARFLVGELLGGSVRYAEAANVTVAAGTSGSVSIPGFFTHGAARVTVENDDAVGGAGAFTARVSVRGF